MTLNIIFSVVGMYKSYPNKFLLHLDGFLLIYIRVWWTSGLHGKSPLEYFPTNNFSMLSNYTHKETYAFMIWEDVEFQSIK